MSARGRTRDAVLAVGDGAVFAREIVGGVLGGRVRRYSGEVLRQSSLLITGSMLVVLGMVFALGLVVGIQGSYAARQVGAPSVAGAFAAIGDLREITPYAFGYMMSAKVSTGFVAEIGTMRITDEIDALDVMGMDSVLFLCSTRLLGSWLILPFLYALGIVVAFVGSYFAVVVQVAQVSPGGYFELFWKFQSPQDYLFSGIKAMAMATFVVLVGCYYGYKVRGGPVEVGAATARAMIVNLVGVHFIGIVGSQIFWGGTPRLPIGG
ncbi:putative ABC transport system permease protein [Patulibacter medicamentivorans]|uniref:Putative ABC transport system permease protein n=1 Tax=Patulibacter medicamentivorans TaxID=1097667 RepID=H0E4W5_9ACTN|nr:ABC transporter permease [Patulibacter medicamentivorans]EHN11282.1 putative ABC transport system permease protein [Patulibacter medicamentivorans]